jgi:hypothetical protein
MPRFGRQLKLRCGMAKDMIAVRIGPDTGVAVVGALACFARRPKKTRDLTAHDCINLGLPTYPSIEAELIDRRLEIRRHSPMPLFAGSDHRQIYVLLFQLSCHGRQPMVPRGRIEVPG